MMSARVVCPPLFAGTLTSTRSTCRNHIANLVSFSTVTSAAKPTGFHKLSSDFLGTEVARDYVVEFSAFTVIALISAWPILSSIVAVARMARGY